MLNSPPTVIIDRYSIAARETEYACGNPMHLFIKFLFTSQAVCVAENLCFGKVIGLAGIHAVWGYE